jgi:hypothetical protein
MNFLKKIFGINSNPKHAKKDEIKTTSNILENIDYYENSWTNNDIPIADLEISKLIYNFELNSDAIDQFLNYGEGSDSGSTNWENKGIFNFPGPFYTGETDTCCTGIIEAPQNVIFDAEGMEHIMIQPRTKKELLQVWDAGKVEVYGQYYCDGNNHWTIELVKEWWGNKDTILELLKNKRLISINCNQNLRYESYLETKAEIDLRKYCFFLDNRYYPIKQEEKLPDL